MTKLLLASSLIGEHSLLTHVVENMSDHDRKREYASWLRRQGDPRGTFLDAVLDQWNAGSGELPTDDSLSIVWQRMCGVTLLQEMRRSGLDDVIGLFAAVRPALMINPEVSESELPIGASKFGGMPDLPGDRAWPEFRRKLLKFVGQINLADIASTQLVGELPAEGLLSFFVFDDCALSGEVAGGGASGASKVFFSPSASGLERRAPHKRFVEGNEIAPECSLEFEETLDLPYFGLFQLDWAGADQITGCRRAIQIGLTKQHSDAIDDLHRSLMPDAEERSHLLGWSHPQVAADDPLDEAHRNLLTVASESTCEFCWADGHQLYFGISDMDLKNRNFDQSIAVDG